MQDQSQNTEINPHLNTVFYAFDFLDREERHSILELAGQQTLSDGKAYTKSGSSHLPRRSKVTWIPYVSETSWLFTKLEQLVLQYNSNCYHFQIQGFFEGLQYARYSEKDYFDWHQDIGIGKAALRKISISIQLSESNDYQGGDLEFLNPIEKDIRPAGTAVVFPSYLSHRVSPVTRNTRHALVAWAHGQNHFM